MCGGISHPAKGGIMNPRIIKLGVESGMLNYVDHETPRHYFLSAHADEECLERFAELLIRECSDLIDDHDDSYPYRSFGDMFKEHFGVKE
jgi:hypothetical protein